MEEVFLCLRVKVPTSVLTHITHTLTVQAGHSSPLILPFDPGESSSGTLFQTLCCSLLPLCSEAVQSKPSHMDAHIPTQTPLSPVASLALSLPHTVSLGAQIHTPVHRLRVAESPLLHRRKLLHRLPQPIQSASPLSLSLHPNDSPPS